MVCLLLESYRFPYGGMPLFLNAPACGGQGVKKATDGLPEKIEAYLHKERNLFRTDALASDFAVFLNGFRF